MTVTSVSQCRNALAAAMPAKPPPMITTCGLLDLSRGRAMTNDSLMFALTLCQRLRPAGNVSLLLRPFRPSETLSLFWYEARGGRAAFRHVLPQVSRWSVSQLPYERCR